MGACCGKKKSVALLDTDGDGIPDHLDDDIDGDGIPNHLDEDANGDGIPDVNRHAANSTCTRSNGVLTRRARSQWTVTFYVAIPG